jgi:alpha-tubulin suppressor-like RCC1 family protein
MRRRHRPGWRRSSLLYHVSLIAIIVSGIAISPGVERVHATTPSSAGTAWAWGEGGFGRLGNGTRKDYFLDQRSRAAPVRVSMPAGVVFTAVSAGFMHSLALAPDGTAWAWGDGFNGSLGAGGVVVSGIPVKVTMPVGVRFTAVSAGPFSVALASNGTAWAWGHGEIGDGGTSQSQSDVPVKVRMPAGVKFTAVSAGGLALAADGSVWAWGDNSFGQLGNGTTVSSSVPVKVRMPAGVTFTSVSAGAGGPIGPTSLALASDGTAWAWGSNTDGELGDGTRGTPSTVPVRVSMPAGATFTSVSAGGDHSLALASDGTAWAWGSNTDGEFGNGTMGFSTVPVRVRMPAGVRFTHVSAGWEYSLALGSDGSAWAWGGNEYGQLGTGKPGDASTPCYTCHSDIPVRVTMPAGVTFTSVSAGAYHSLALQGRVIPLPAAPAQRPGPPTNVSASPANGSAYVSWNPPAQDGGSPIAGYTVHASSSDIGAALVTVKVGGTVTSTRVYGLTSNCHSTYSFTVTATNAKGTGPPGGQSEDIRPSGVYSDPPTNVVIAIRGVQNSATALHPWNPLKQDYCYLYRSPNPQLAEIGNSFDPNQSLPENLTDAMAATGALILPLSYNGSWLVPDPSTPGGYLFSENTYNNLDTWTHTPLQVAEQLWNEVYSIHSAWPFARIVIVGHSLGGDIAETYFEQYFNVHDSKGVTNIFSLDSPVNGLQDVIGAAALLCAIEGISGCVGGAFSYWAYRWINRQTSGHAALVKDAASGNPGPPYIPIGTIGDLLYVDFNSPCSGLRSQLLYDSGDCGDPNPVLVGPDVGTPEGVGPPLIQPGYPTDPACCSILKLGASHTFVFQSSYNICLITYLGLNAHPCSGVGAARAVFRDKRAPAAPSFPTTHGRISSEVVSPGDADSISGSGFGTTQGKVEFFAPAGQEVDAHVTSWSGTSIRLLVPAGAATGPVFVLTRRGLGREVGAVTVLGPNNGVDSLSVRLPARRSLDGQITTVKVRAVNAAKVPVIAAEVKITAGIRAMAARTDGSGLATFHIRGYGTQPFETDSGTGVKAFSVTWARPPVMHMNLTSSATGVRAGHPVVVTARIANATDHPVSHTAVFFNVSGSSGITLSRMRILTNIRGVARTTVSASSPGTAVIDASADDSSVAKDVSINWRAEVTRVNPSGGAAAGGTIVTITGLGFGPGADVSFGSAKARRITVVSPTKIIAVSPGVSSSRTVHVVVTLPGGATPATKADRFRYTGTNPNRLVLHFRGSLQARHFGTLAVHVTSARGRALSGVAVTLHGGAVGLPLVLRRKTDTHGATAFSTIRPTRAGKIVLRASKPGYRGVTANVPVLP